MENQTEKDREAGQRRVHSHWGCQIVVLFREKPYTDYCGNTILESLKVRKLRVFPDSLKDPKNGAP